MALSNIFREPRREIIETAVGVVCFVPFAVAVYEFACFISDNPGGLSGAPFVVYVVFSAAWLVLAIGFGWMALCEALRAAHAIGESLCDALERGGIHLRPRDHK